MSVPGTTDTSKASSLNGFTSDNDQAVANNSNEVKNEPPKSKYLLVSILCSFVAMGGFVFGYDTGTISGYINMPVFISHFGQMNSDGDYYFSKVRSGLMVSIFSIGAALGGIVFSKIGDVRGRKVGIMTACIVYIVGVLIQITAMKAWYQVFIGRLIGGMGIGMLAVLVPMFQSETAPKEIRGTLVSTFQLFVTLGIFIGYCVCYGTNTRTDTGSYRIPMGLCFAWALLLFVGVSFLPESPRFLVGQDKFDEARKSLAFSTRLKENDAYVCNEIDEIAASIAHERDCGVAGWSELFKGKPAIFYRLFVGIILMSMNQLAGANYFFYYGTSIFKAIGMTNSFATSMIFGAVNFVSTCCALVIVGRFGRRLVLLWGYAGMFVFFVIYASLGVKALYPNGEHQPASNSVGKGMIAVTCFYIFCFATSIGPLAYVVVSELYPTRIRSKGVSLATSFSWMWNFLIGFFTPFITGAIGFNYGYVFSGCLAFGLFFEYFCVHETKDLSLEQIDEMFASGVKPWESAKWVPAEHTQPSYENKPAVEAAETVEDISNQV